MNKEFFEKCFVFLAEFTNLNQIFSREKKKIEDHVRKLTATKREKIYKQYRKEIKDGFEELKNKSIPPEEIIEYCKDWVDLLVDQIEECQQEIVTYHGCLVQAEVAFLKGQIISMINPSGKLADFGKSAVINKD